MQLFNNLRKRIVDKLIRPEDGYTHTGRPVRFCYNPKTDKYILCSESEYGYYLEPTLTGWTDANIYGCGLQEIEFNKWIHGVLDNVCVQYFERLDNLSMQELKSIHNYKKEDGDKFVITKKSFCDIMYALESYWTNLRSLEGILNVYFERGMMMDIIDKVVDALEEELEPQFYDPELDFDINEDPMIMRWLTGLESDRTVDGCLLASAEELYDYLVDKREKTLEKVEKTLDNIGNI